MFSYFTVFLGWLPPFFVDLLMMSAKIFIWYLGFRMLKLLWDILPLA